MACQKGDWKKMWSTGILLPKETKPVDKHVRRQTNRTREKGTTVLPCVTEDKLAQQRDGIRNFL